MPFLDVDLSSIEEGVNQYEFRAAPEQLDLEEPRATYRRNVDVEVTVSRTGDTMTVRGSIQTSVERECGRCLERYTDDVDTDFFEAVQIDGDVVRILDDQYDGDPGLLNVHGGTMRLDPIVREAVLVNAPMKPICSDDCKGLCSVCGADRNKVDCGCVIEIIHPAWQALRDLTSKQEKRD